jgi:ABC-2 type transport system ATP-binding protein
MSRERGGIAEAVRRLDSAGVGIADIAVRRPTLDDVFMSLTGHAAEHENGGAQEQEQVEEREEQVA